MLILALDCSASLCAACVWDREAQAERGRSVRDLGKGHAEHLMAVVDEALGAAGATLRDMDAVAVSIGPGSFTGIRVAVSAARGFALALGVPAVGISTLEAIAAEARASAPVRSIASVLPGGPGLVQIAVYDPFAMSVYHPQTVTVEEALSIIQEVDAALAGGAAEALAASSSRAAAVLTRGATADIAVYAQLAAGRANANSPRPAPLYLRAPDARPQAGFVVSRRDDP